MTILRTDKELLEALLRGDKVEKVRHSGFGVYIHLKNGQLIDAEGNPANIFRITPSDLFQIIDSKENKE